MIPNRARWADLARSFPSLDGAPGIEPFDLEALTRWSRSRGSGARHAVRFVVSVWNPDAPLQLGLESFDVHAALGAWDLRHRAAFVAWARAPWWP